MIDHGKGVVHAKGHSLRKASRKGMICVLTNLILGLASSY